VVFCVLLVSLRANIACPSACRDPAPPEGELSRPCQHRPELRVGDSSRARVQRRRL